VPLLSGVPWLSANMSQYYWTDQIDDKMGGMCNIYVKEEKMCTEFWSENLK
jgi:hypothetical protein